MIFSLLSNGEVNYIFYFSIACRLDQMWINITIYSTNYCIKIFDWISGDTVMISKQLYQKYQPGMKSQFFKELTIKNRR